MNGLRFDRLARELAGNMSRRSVLKRLAGLTLGAAFASARTPQGTLAACDGDFSCPGVEQHCFVDVDIRGACACLQAQSSMLCRGDVCHLNADCGSGQVCRPAQCGDLAGRCWNGCLAAQPCPDGMTRCKGSCVDTANDNTNCGQCGYFCQGGEALPGYKAMGACVSGVCVEVCEENADHCGDRCTDFQVDFSNCGTCGNQCGDKEQCCGGRCVAKTDAQRFCSGCGSYYGWPQSCAADETCDRGICVALTASGAVFTDGATIDIVVVACPEQPFMLEPPPPETTASSWLKIWENNGQCGRLDGIVVNARSTDGQTASCTTVGGRCTLNVGGLAGPLTVTEANEPAGADLHIITHPSFSALMPGVPVINLVNLGVSPGPAASTGPVPDAGTLAYAVKNSGQWDVWLHDLATGDNTQLTNLPNSDQWAPAWSHDGKRLAYLSDQADGTNQVWLMDPDGKHQRQLTKHSGKEAIAYVAWAPKDDQLIVTLRGQRGDRLVVMPAEGGAFSNFRPAQSSFATTTASGELAYVIVKNGVNAIQMGPFASGQSGLTETIGGGTTACDAPNLDTSGRYPIFQVGEKGTRQIKRVNSRGIVDLPQPGNDASNPVYLGKGIVFVSSDGKTESIVFLPASLVGFFTLPIAPHDNVWYLAARPEKASEG